jgi:hypothetical protein
VCLLAALELHCDLGLLKHLLLRCLGLAAVAAAAAVVVVAAATAAAAAAAVPMPGLLYALLSLLLC